MLIPQAGDVLIRVQTNTLPTSYVVVQADTHRILAGPFASMAEAAIAAAKYVRPMAAIWSQQLDHHGQPRDRARRFPGTTT